MVEEVEGGGGEGGQLVVGDGEGEQLACTGHSNIWLVCGLLPQQCYLCQCTPRGVLIILLVYFLFLLFFPFLRFFVLAKHDHLKKKQAVYS